MIVDFVYINRVRTKYNAAIHICIIACQIDELCTLNTFSLFLFS